MKLVLISPPSRWAEDISKPCFGSLGGKTHYEAQEDNLLISSEATVALWIAYLNCLTNQLLVDFAHSAGPLLLVNNTSAWKGKKEVRREEGKSCLIVQTAINKTVWSIRKKKEHKNKNNIPLLMLASPPSYTSAFARTCLTSSGSLLGVPVFLHVCLTNTPLSTPACL